MIAFIKSSSNVLDNKSFVLNFSQQKELKDIISALEFTSTQVSLQKNKLLVKLQKSTLEKQVLEKITELSFDLRHMLTTLCSKKENSFSKVTSHTDMTLDDYREQTITLLKEYADLSDEISEIFNQENGSSKSLQKEIESPQNIQNEE